VHAKYTNNKKIINYPPLPTHNEPNKRLNPVHDRRTKTIIDIKQKYILTDSRVGAFLVTGGKDMRDTAGSISRT